MDLNWKNDKFTRHVLKVHSSKTLCVKFYKNWIITGSDDWIIRIWDIETFQCLRVIGEPDLKLLKYGIPDLEFLYRGN